MKPIACPCGISYPYVDCCGRYISGTAYPVTAEALMRSRYTAYTLANIPYIQTTMLSPAADGFDPQQAEQWAKAAKWKRLKIIGAEPHPTELDCAYVTFRAFYIFEGKPQEIIEKSEFKRVDGKWYYTAQDYPS